MQKPRFSNGFSMISRVRRAAKSLNNQKKSNPECLGTPRYCPGRAGLIKTGSEVAVGQGNKGQTRKFLGGGPAPAGQQPLEPRPRGRVGKG